MPICLGGIHVKISLVQYERNNIVMVIDLKNMMLFEDAALEHVSSHHLLVLRLHFPNKCTLSVNLRNKSVNLNYLFYLVSYTKRLVDMPVHIRLEEDPLEGDLVVKASIKSKKYRKQKICTTTASQDAFGCANASQTA